MQKTLQEMEQEIDEIDVDEEPAPSPSPLKSRKEEQRYLQSIKEKLDELGEESNLVVPLSFLRAILQEQPVTPQELKRITQIKHVDYYLYKGKKYNLIARRKINAKSYYYLTYEGYQLTTSK